MKKYKELQAETPEIFKRLTGLSKENFQHLCFKTDDYINKEKERNQLKQRGLKKSKLSLEDRVLLTIYYLRHYPTFINLANIFDIARIVIVIKYILVIPEFL